MPNTKWPVRILASLMFLSLLVPFLVSKELLFPFVTTRAFYFRILIELALPFYVFLLLKDSKLRPNLKNPLSLSVLLFWLINLISGIFGVNPIRALWGNYERMGGVFYFLHLTAFYFYLLLLAKAWPRLFKIFLQAWVICAGLISLYSVFITYLGMKPFMQDPSLPLRASAFFGNPIYLGSFLVLPLALAGFLFFQSESKWWKFFWLFLFLLQLGGICASGTRGAVIAMVIAAFLFGLAFLVFTKNKKIKFWGLLLVIFFALGSFFLYFKVSKLPAISRFTRIVRLNDSNTGARLIQWQMGIRGFKDFPVLGTGPENYYVISNKYFNPQMYKFDRSWFDKPHNYLLEILLTTGVLGFALYSAIVIFAFWSLVKGLKQSLLSAAEFCVLAGGFFAYQVQNLFVFENISSSVLFYAFLAFCAFLWQQSASLAEKNKKKNIQPANLNPIFIYTATFVSAAIVVIMLYCGNIIPIKISRAVNYGFAYDLSDPVKTLGYYEKARGLPLNFDRGEFALKYADFATRFVQSELSQKFPQEANEALNNSIDALETTVAEQNNYSAYWLKLAEAHLVRGIVTQKKLDLAVWDDLDKAISLAPKRTEARGFKAQILLLQNRVQEAEQILEGILADDPNNSAVPRIREMMKGSGGK